MKATTMQVNDRLRDEHYINLCQWRGKLNFNFNTLIGKKWEITEAIYWEFLELLPPLIQTENSFTMSEFLHGMITEKYTQEGNRYFCEFIEFGG